MNTEINGTPPSVTKVTLNMSKKTIDDLDKIAEIMGTSNKTQIINMAIRLYKRLLEIQETEKGSLIVEDKKGNTTRMELVH